MGEIFVVIEHRRGEIRDITFEMLSEAQKLCTSLSYTLTAVLIGEGNGIGAQDFTAKADRVIVVDDERVKTFDADLSKEILSQLMEEYHPFITLCGHTPYGMDLAPALSIRKGYPLATDCVDILLEDGRPKVIRQIYNGKIFTKVSFRESESYIFTIRPGAFSPDEGEDRQGEVVSWKVPDDLPHVRKQFVGFVDAGSGDVDISQAEFLISIGRGIGEPERIEEIKELVDRIGGTISCSRPVVDKNWLPKYHQVGTSGKSVKPKVYLALGISGAFQHVAGITSAGTVIAVNKDPKAPIFRVAHYGVVSDLFKIVDALKEQIGAG
jgi:electron transfer flavoprotein alpha subunit